jgi:hypothetical protein
MSDPLPSFVDELPDDVSCCVCLQPARQPTRTPCAHLFCADCIAAWLAGGATTCPIDRSAVVAADLRLDDDAAEAIGALAVRCTHHPTCDWTGAWASLPAHVNLCDRRPVACALAAVGCRHVGDLPAAAEHRTAAALQHVDMLAAALAVSEAGRRETALLVSQLATTVASLRDDVQALKDAASSRQQSVGGVAAAAAAEARCLHHAIAVANSGGVFSEASADPAVPSREALHWCDGGRGSLQRLVADGAFELATFNGGDGGGTDPSSAASPAAAQLHTVARHTAAGWHTLIARPAVHLPRAAPASRDFILSFGFQVLTPPDGAAPFASSTLLIGATCNEGAGLYPGTPLHRQPAWAVVLQASGFVHVAGTRPHSYRYAEAAAEGAALFGPGDTVVLALFVTRDEETATPRVSHLGFTVKGVFRGSVVDAAGENVVPPTSLYPAASVLAEGVAVRLLDHLPMAYT